MASALSESDKVRIRHHMGYPAVKKAAIFALGFPATVDTVFIIENAMNQVQDESVALVQTILARLDTIEGQMAEDEDLLAVTSVGEIDIREDEQEALDRRYERWLAKLENALAVPRNPFDKVPEATRGISVPVRH